MTKDRVDVPCIHLIEMVHVTGMHTRDAYT